LSVAAGQVGNFPALVRDFDIVELIVFGMRQQEWRKNLPQPLFPLLERIAVAGIVSRTIP